MMEIYLLPNESFVSLNAEQNNKRIAECIYLKGLRLPQQRSEIKVTFSYFKYTQGKVIPLYSTALRRALGPTQPPIQWTPCAIFLVAKQPEREAVHSHPSSADVRIVGLNLNLDV
jgi:hypothetical protein